MKSLLISSAIRSRSTILVSRRTRQGYASHLTHLSQQYWPTVASHHSNEANHLPSKFRQEQLRLFVGVAGRSKCDHEQ